MNNGKVIQLSPINATKTCKMAMKSEDSFDDFFNSETLSDRVLYIVEVEELLSTNVREGSEKRKLRNDEDEDEEEVESKRRKDGEEEEEDAIEEKEVIELAESEVKQEEEEVEEATSSKIADNFEPEFSVDDMIKSVHYSSEVTLQVLNKQIPENVALPAKAAESPVAPTTASDTEEATRTKVVVKETKVFVHSVILAAKSEYFKLLLSTSGMKETKEKDVSIKVGRGETENMLILLQCFYNKSRLDDNPLATVFSVCSLAMKYCFDGLIDKCLDIFRYQAEALITEVDDINQIASMVSKIQNELNQHKDKCQKVMKSCWPLLLKSFYPLDECLEKTPLKFFQLHLNSMYLFLEPSVQFNNEHGNLFVYAIQRWVKAHASFLTNDGFKSDVTLFVEKLLNTVDISLLTGDFMTNIMTPELSPFNVWSGYKDWYIRALQNCVWRYNASSDALSRKTFPMLKRQRHLKFIRRENNNTDIFALRTPVILNGFEIGIYFRVRDDRKMYMIAKCKNIIVNKTGFDKCSLTFNIQGTLKLVAPPDNTFMERFPAQQSGWLHEWLTFSYKQSGVCLQMYAICKLSPTVYSMSKQTGFLCTFHMQQLK